MSSAQQQDVHVLITQQVMQEKPDWNAVSEILRKNPQAVKSLQFPDGCNILHMACSNSAPLSFVQLIVQQHPNADTEKSDQGYLPLHVACGRNQSLEVIRWLIQRHPETVNDSNVEGGLPLHLACRKNQSLEVIQLLVQQVPDTVKVKDDDGHLPLYIACGQNQSLKVIQWLARQYPDAVKEKDNVGHLPFHSACARNQSLKVIQWLARQHPVAVKEKNEFGDLPLHLACAFNQSLEVIQWLARQHPNAVNENNNDGRFPLHLACANKQPLKVIRWLIQKHPSVAKEKQIGGNLPLHMACAFNQSLEVIDVLVQQYPNSVKERSSFGDLPLHVACANKQSFEVIQWLVQQHPNGVKGKNNDCNLPLHEACAWEQPLEVIDLLVQQHPDTVKGKNKDGYIPLHLACARPVSLDVIQLLVQHHPNTVKAKNSNGRLPLHLACKYQQSLEVIQCLVQDHPDTITEKNDDGNLPLHVACGFKQSLDVIQLLVQQYPDTITEKNKDGNTPLHLACGFNQSLEVIYLLVQQYPDTTTVKNNDGELPLHLACGFKQSLEVIQLLVQQYPDAVNTKTGEGDVPLHLACGKKQSLEVIQFLVQHHPETITEMDSDGLTPSDLAKLPLDGQPDAETVHWLEAVESGEINLTKTHPVPRRLTPLQSKEASQDHSPPPSCVGDMDLAKPSTGDRRTVPDILQGKTEVATASSSYSESIRIEELLGYGVFGTLCKRTDTELHRTFAIKAINTGGHLTIVEKAKEALLVEVNALSLFRHPIIEALYAGGSPDNVKCSYYEPAEKGSLEDFLKGDLGPERLSLFRRRIQIALDVMTAVQFLHVGNGYIASCPHGNIKSANIVLKRDFTAQLINCGLAKSGVDAQWKSDSLNGSAPELENSYDIFSFGEILAELLTGKCQNHKDECGPSFRFEKQFIKDENDLTRNIKKELDDALGYDTWELPKYVQDFADLAICCLQPNPDDRPLGDAVMEKLAAISRQCGSRKSDANSRISDGDCARSKLEKFAGKCKFCRTFPPESTYNVCAVCKSAQERRAQVSFRGEIRRLVGTNVKLDALPPLLCGLDIRLNNPVPRLFILVPFVIKSAFAHPKTWLRSQHRTRYYLYFVCSHDMKTVEPPLSIIVTKRWVERVAPVLATSLFLLHRSLKPGVCIDFGFRESGVMLRLNSTRIAEILEAVGDILIETGSFDFLVRLRSNMAFDAEDINQLNGDAYELIVETADGESGWRRGMVPVTKNGSPQIFWVSRAVAYDTSNGYAIAQVGFADVQAGSADADFSFFITSP